MLTRNDQPIGLDLHFSTEGNFNFAVDSVFTNSRDTGSGIINDEFLLLDGSAFLLLDGTDFLLL